MKIARRSEAKARLDHTEQTISPVVPSSTCSCDISCKVLEQPYPYDLANGSPDVHSLWSGSTCFLCLFSIDMCSWHLLTSWGFHCSFNFTHILLCVAYSGTTIEDSNHAACCLTLKSGCEPPLSCKSCILLPCQASMSGTPSESASNPWRIWACLDHIDRSLSARIDPHDKVDPRVASS